MFLKYKLIQKRFECLDKRMDALAQILKIHEEHIERLSTLMITISHTFYPQKKDSNNIS